MAPENKPSDPKTPQERWPNCPECERLWKAYALATRKQFDAILAREDAAQTDDVENLKILKAKALEATQWWALARKAVRDHAATHAGEKPETQK